MWAKTAVLELDEGLPKPFSRAVRDKRSNFEFFKRRLNKLNRNWLLCCYCFNLLTSSSLFPLLFFFNIIFAFVIAGLRKWNEWEKSFSSFNFSSRLSLLLGALLPCSSFDFKQHQSDWVFEYTFLPPSRRRRRSVFLCFNLESSGSFIFIALSYSLWRSKWTSWACERENWKLIISIATQRKNLNE